jgi:hypothetical protein
MLPLLTLPFEITTMYLSKSKQLNFSSNSTLFLTFELPEEQSDASRSFFLHKVDRCTSFNPSCTVFEARLLFLFLLSKTHQCCNLQRNMGRNGQYDRLAAESSLDDTKLTT